MNPLILFKKHEIPECETLLSITRYLWYKNIDVRPKNVIERNFPQKIKILPTIVLPNKEIIEGLDNIVNFYEQLFEIDNLENNALLFIKNNPNFRISDMSTHKKMNFNLFE
ncbi:MAG: hypothetical protein Harvfovirus32_4 [Harvfovirus sp.]|uniref:Uncharacterized protein n=1 Tax=Harvfovirus sp. TaxID=2487768 RepID=A0A3G5A2F9_9VIRU|nr:MAG: hypothetical protein Harvfovirus32_4 [Harvfovirus sp.]